MGALNEYLCDFGISSADNVPAAAGYVSNVASTSDNSNGPSGPGGSGPSDRLSSGWGVAVSGVMLYNPTGGSGVDAFYPAPFISSKAFIING